MSVINHVSNKLLELPQGKPFTYREFISLGNQRNISKILERLAINGKIKRVRRGIYVRPKFNPHVGEVPPSTKEVIKAIAATTGEVIQVQGAEAARMLGLSTQAPVREIYYTSGRTREIKIGNNIIKLKNVSSKKLILPGTEAGLAITALWYLGKEQVTLKTFSIIQKRISRIEFEKLLHNKNAMPLWMALCASEYEENISNESSLKVSKISSNFERREYNNTSFSSNNYHVVMGK